MRTTKKAAETIEAPVKAASVDQSEAASAKETKKTAAKKATAAKKSATAKKSTSTKTTTETTAKKTTRKKAHVVNQEVYIQFWGKEVYAKEVVERIKGIWVNEMGKKPEELLDLKVYIKPEENGAHYVINGDITGFIGL